MFPHSTPQPQATQQNMGVLAAGAKRLLEQTQIGHSAPHWVCTGCGAAHGGILPEECRNCGATALEFEYTLPHARQARP